MYLRGADVWESNYTWNGRCLYCSWRVDARICAVNLFTHKSREHLNSIDIDIQLDANFPLSLTYHCSRVSEMTHLDGLHMDDKIMPDGNELQNICVALKITHTSGSAPQKDPVMYQLPAVILSGDYRGLEVTIRITDGHAIFDRLDGTISPLLMVSGTLVRKCIHDRCAEHGFFFLCSVAHDLFYCLNRDESIIKNFNSHLWVHYAI